MDTHEPETGDVGAAPSVARLLLELRGRVNVDVKPAGRNLQVRPSGSTAIAVRIHPGGVDLAVDPNRANEVALSMPGAYVRDPDDPDCIVSVEADLIDANYDALLDAAVQSVELRAAGRPAKAARATRARVASTAPKTTRAAAAPAKARPVERPEPPRCPKCRQYELLASGECPSGYC